VKQEAARLEGRLTGYDEELKQYEDIPEQEARLEQAEQLLALVEADRARLQRLENVRDSFDRSDREEIMVTAQLARLGDLEAAAGGLRRAEELHRDGTKLERLSADLNRVEQEGRIYRSRIDTLTALPIAEQRAREAAEQQARLTQLARIGGDLKLRDGELSRLQGQLARLGTVEKAGQQVAGATEKIQRLERLQEKLTHLQEVQQRVNKGKEMLRDTEAELRAHLAEYEAVLKRLGQCPTCLQPVAPGTVRKIIAELAGGPASGHHHG
ncbi:MAG TPA: hypothetical protein VD902_18090, partial [Symbiobacteriaceae bacterium]|nr:hypothetical protein [Symbiobacteriaceae bacterium]